MRTICLYIDRTCRSNSSSRDASNDFADAAMYSSGTPSTVSMARTRPRTRRAFAVSGELPVSIVSATFARAESARIFGEVGAVQTTMRSPFQ